MSKVYRYFVARFKTAVGAFLMVLASVASAEQPAGQLIDSPYEAVEAEEIVLMVNASGEVVGIRGKGCPGCPSSTILPARDLVVDAARGRRIEGQELTNLNGRPGVIHVYRPTGMAHRVSFPGILYTGGDEQ